MLLMDVMHFAQEKFLFCERCVSIRMWLCVVCMRWTAGQKARRPDDMNNGQFRMK